MYYGTLHTRLQHADKEEGETSHCQPTPHISPPTSTARTARSGLYIPTTWTHEHALHMQHDPHALRGLICNVPKRLGRSVAQPRVVGTNVAASHGRSALPQDPISPVSALLTVSMMPTSCSRGVSPLLGHVGLMHGRA
eukprot:1776828-Prymnesium_polylepis.1